MKLEFNREQLLQLMRDFYILSGIRMVLFDDEYRELLSYPEDHCAFCARIRQNPEVRKLCARSDEASFEKSGQQRKLILYRCHAGLMEAAIPLIDNHIVIGYLMFGQIADCASTQQLAAQLGQQLAHHGIAADFDTTQGIPLKTSEQIQAAGKIMEACTMYALRNQTISLRREHFSNELRAFLLAHLSEPLNSHSIAQAFGISRSKLYQQCQQYLDMGVTEYLRTLRMEQAQKLLRDTSIPITQIADMVGFDDYNYFCRVFRQENGISPKKFRSGFPAPENDSPFSQ